MRKLLAAVAALALAAVPGASGAPGAGYVDATANVTYVGTVPLDPDTGGARLVGDRFYVLSSRGVTIYDVSTPERPSLLGALVLPQEPRVSLEDVDTNGRILVTGQAETGMLYVLDVSNPRLPTLLAALRGAGAHTYTCVLDCAWAYTSEGAIIDLRDPRNPKVAGDWRPYAKAGEYAHDWTEVRPGLLVGATSPVVYLDARRNPLAPRRLALGALPDDRFVHGAAWPRDGRDRWLVAGTESELLCGAPNDGSLMVFDTRRQASAGRLDFTGSFTLLRGRPTEGRAPESFACGHWFSAHPAFKDGGLLAVAWYGFGTRFVEVTKTGKLVERGWFMGGGDASAAYWISPTVVYSVDYVRGIDILRFDPKAKPGRPVGGQWTPRRAGTTFSDVPPARPDGRYYVCPVPARAR